jgi:hypothetical protein
MSVTITVQGEAFHLDDDAESRVRHDIQAAVRGGGGFVSIGGTTTDVLVTPQSSVRIDRVPDGDGGHRETGITRSAAEFVDFSVF